MWAQSCRAEVVPIQIDLAADRLADRLPPVDWALLLAGRVATAASRDDPIGELTAVAGVSANSIMHLRADQLVYMSSGSVYETLTGHLSPTRTLSPRLPYAIAKLAAESLFASYAEAPYWSVRFFGAFGPGEPPFKLARRLVETFARGDSHFIVHGDGSNYIDPLYIKDAAAAIVLLLTTPAQTRTVDLSQGEWLTVRRFVEVAYQNVHPSPDDGELELNFRGEAHEQMRGKALSDPVFSGLGDRRLTIADGFREYARTLRGR
jgi:nucleoside-diphosphate-sugar epimerase